MSSELARNTAEIHNPANRIRLWNANQLYWETQNAPRKYDYDPLAPLCLFNRRHDITSITGEKSPIVTMGEREAVMEGIYQFSHITHAMIISELLKHAIETNVAGTIEMTNIDSDGLIWNQIAETFVDLDEEAPEHFLDGRKSAIQYVLKHLEGGTPLDLFQRRDIGLVPDLITVKGTSFLFDTRLKGVKAHYFYPLNTQEPTVSLNVEEV